MPRPRVLIWYWGRKGGGPRYTLELARALAAREDISLRLSLSRQSELYDEFADLNVPRWDVDTYQSAREFSYRSLALLRLRQKFAGFVMSEQIELVFCTMEHLWNNAVTGVLRGAQIPYLLTVHDAMRHPGEGNAVRDWLLRSDIKAADGVLTLTESVRQAVIAKYSFPAERTWTAPHGHFSYGGTTRVRELPLNRPLRLLFFGRILAYKGLDLLLEAIPLVRGAGCAVELEIWGDGNLQPYARQLAQLDGVRIENRWIKESEVPGVLARVDVSVLPYREASQSGIIPLMFAAGIPVVVTPIPGLLEQALDRRNAIVVREVSGTALAEGIVALLKDAALFRRLSGNAVETAMTEFNWTEIGRKVTTAIQELTAAGLRQRK
jgi:glycosyltransferase involved in cell wall biosynthesis